MTTTAEIRGERPVSLRPEVRGLSWEKRKAETLKAEVGDEGSAVGGQRSECQFQNLVAEILKAESGGFHPVLFMTRDELAEVLKISVSLVDLMVRRGELTCLRLRGNYVRFYLPHVIRDLVAASAVSKRRFTRGTGSVEPGASSVERKNGNPQN